MARTADDHRREGERRVPTIRVDAMAEGLRDAVAEHREEIVGRLREIDGVRGYHIVRTGPASATSITVCDAQAGAEASSRVAHDYIATELGHLSVSAPEIHAGEVAMST